MPRVASATSATVGVVGLNLWPMSVGGTQTPALWEVVMRRWTEEDGT